MKDVDQKFATMYYATQMRSAMFDIATDNTMKSYNYYTNLDASSEINDQYKYLLINPYSSLMIFLYANKFCNLQWYLWTFYLINYYIKH